MLLASIQIYARYSFQIIFPSDGTYSVYFEDCYRQQGTLNNELLTFHVCFHCPLQTFQSPTTTKTFGLFYDGHVYTDTDGGGVLATRGLAEAVSEI